jgi:hypothetical protein
VIAAAEYRRRREEYKAAADVAIAVGAATSEEYYDNLTQKLEEQIGERSTGTMPYSTVSQRRLQFPLESCMRP